MTGLQRFTLDGPKPRSQKLDLTGWQVFADFALQYGLIEKGVDVRTVIWSKE
jgi:hypothetical protein